MLVRLLGSNTGLAHESPMLNCLSHRSAVGEQVERFNKTLVEMLRARLQPDQKDWDLHLSACMMAYRSSAHESTEAKL